MMPDLIDISCALSSVELEAKHLARRFLDAGLGGEEANSVLRNHFPELQKLREMIALILARAEAGCP
jgi:hypothetical protein